MFNIILKTNHWSPTWGSVFLFEPVHRELHSESLCSFRIKTIFIRWKHLKRTLSKFECIITGSDPFMSWIYLVTWYPLMVVVQNVSECFRGSSKHWKKVNESNHAPFQQKPWLCLLGSASVDRESARRQRLNWIETPGQRVHCFWKAKCYCLPSSPPRQLSREAKCLRVHWKPAVLFASPSLLQALLLRSSVTGGGECSPQQCARQLLVRHLGWSCLECTHSVGLQATAVAWVDQLGGAAIGITCSTVSLLSIQTNAFFSTGSRRNAEWYREKIRCHSVRTIKVLRMQPLNGDYDIIWRSYMSVKFAKRLNTWR